MTDLTSDISIIIPSTRDDYGFNVVTSEIDEETGTYKIIDLYSGNFTFGMFENGDGIYIGCTSLSKIKELFPNAIGVANYATDGFFDTFILNDGTLERPNFAENDYYSGLILFDTIPNNATTLILNPEFV